ncbi:MAG: CoxG family protein [Leptothrix sp. (in: b-proteobacteria)]
MQLSNTQTLPVSQAIAWESLNDMTLIQQAIPGCEGIVTVGENEYEVVVVAAIGPVKAKFKGKLMISDIVAPTSYNLAFEGQGGAAGHGKGNAQVTLTAKGDNETELGYVVHATVGGKIAQIGSRLVDMAANKMANEFFAKFTAVLAERHAPAPAEVAEGDAPAEGGEKKGWFKKLIG